MGFKCSHKYKNKNTLLLIIFLVTVIPTIIVYLEHAGAEGKAYEKSIANGNEYKAIKQLGESVLFFSIGFGYIIATLSIMLFPYLVLIIGTIVIVILYYFRIYGIPVLGTDVIIRDISTDWRDVITKICQSIMLVPLSILLVLNTTKGKINSTKKC